MDPSPPDRGRGAAARASALAGSVPAPLLVLTGIVSVQIGAAIAKQLFDVVSPTAMVWLRLITSAVVFVAVIRVRVRGHSRLDWLVAIGYGVCLFVMNWSIYQSFARIPLGTAVTIEFLGPLSIAVVGAIVVRGAGWRQRTAQLGWAVLAAAGVALLGFSPVGLTAAGVGFALLAGAGWAGYILLSAQTGRRWSGLSGLVIASLVGAIVLAPPALVSAGPVLLDWRVLAAGIGVGLLSSVVPYSLELVALRRITPRVFGVLMSLEPAAAALAAMLILREFMAWNQWVALGCVVVASIGATRSSRPADAA